ncbi:MAG TPA: alkaline phosphatase family protein, partial [Candidatus Polarisedimenticolia bacterium]|nr:alkaline phosphatase family protein [Candidatus Polarisedimenticolia bacterium]
MAAAQAAWPVLLDEVMQRAARFAAAMLGFLLLASAPPPGGSPKLVVVIVVDQMPAGYLDRFSRFFGERGFARLRAEGRLFTGARYSHTATLTGPGHSVIGTGAYPESSGIVGNQWFDRKLGTEINSAVGPWKTGATGQCPAASPEPASPASRVPNPCNLLSRSLAERVKQRYPASRVVGVALKDRAAILTPGKGADAAYWLESQPDDSALFACSAYYPDCRERVLAYSHEEGLDAKPGDPSRMTLFQRHPAWRDWSCSLPSPCETQCPDDLASAHAEQAGLGRSFPHDVKNVTALLYTPFGNELLEGLAERVVETYQLGANPHGEPDLLVVGFSSTDYFGHLFGPDSCETADGMKRLDATVGKLLDFLTERVDRERLRVFLTADHGVTPQPWVSLKRGIPAGRVDLSDRGRDPKKIGDLPLLRQRIDFELARHLGIKEDGDTPLSDALIRGYREPNLYLNTRRVDPSSAPRARAWVKEYLLRVEGVAEVYTWDEAMRRKVPASVRLAFRPDRSGDLIIQLKPGWIEWDEDAGTTHGQPYDADARVPLLVWGAGVAPG